MVKSKAALIGTILTFTTLLTCIPMVAAYDYSIGWMVVKSDSQIWEFSTLDPLGNEVFSSKDVDVSTIEAYYWVWDENGNTVEYKINVKDVHLAGHKVSVTFNKDFLPAKADGTKVIGALYTGETFMATGPGFVWRKWG